MDMLIYRRWLLIPTLFAFAFISNQTALAHSHGYTQHVDRETGNQWLLGFGVGGVKRNLPSSISVANGTPVPAPYNQDSYSIHNNHSNKAIIEVFGGYQWRSLNTFVPYYSLSLHYQHQFSAEEITGTVEQYGMPQFTNYNYSMDLNSDIFNLVGKINLIQYQSLLPYVSAGVGIAFNRVSNYTEQAIFPVSPRIDPSYSNHTSNNFAYSLGAGIDLMICRNLWATLGYEYSNLGKVNSGHGTGSWSSTRLRFGTLKTHTVLVSITYLI